MSTCLRPVIDQARAWASAFKRDEIQALQNELRCDLRAVDHRKALVKQAEHAAAKAAVMEEFAKHLEEQPALAIRAVS